MIIPTVIRRSDPTKPSIRPLISMSLPMLRVTTPPMTLAAMFITARRPCLEKDDVTYGDKAVSIDANSADTKHTSQRLPILSIPFRTYYYIVEMHTEQRWTIRTFETRRR